MGDNIAVQTTGSSVSPPQQTPIISIEQLIQSVDCTLRNENADREALSCLLEINEVQLLNSLKLWATQGFAVNHTLFEIRLHKCDPCSDSVHRDLFQYIDYLAPSRNITDVINDLQSRLPGMSISYSYTSDYVFRVHVTKF